MRCPYCAHVESRVIDSRDSKEGDAIRRRRECMGCGKRFTTYEFVEEVLPVIIKKDGRREPFDRSKLLSGIKKACQKRPISIAAIEALIDRVEQACRETQAQEIPSSKVGEKVMEELHDLDDVAYVRFASVYRQFRDTDEFLEQIEDLKKKRKSDLARENK
jgi:transcriptional repressor NrdR